ncbi:hypothetical protein LEP1GSC038_3490 [Leptospira weilii str. 2006001855]|uniref:Uncharacterized protein n=1 Tax=Leptospira weilii str. 2006001855 TaxID=996804 RepID=M6G1N0_9LEPT|nr:hypothetical protein LEP1GSC038_3490 [Leptospira weilii str. 2006001855]
MISGFHKAFHRDEVGQANGSGARLSRPKRIEDFLSKAFQWTSFRFGKIHQTLLANLYSFFSLSVFYISDRWGH